ncbi:hypothetical protein CcrC1_gp099 [Caulobacter phage C1]|nr:hypothetical protein CcrC1_gp099 [Caulobacter phage C1]UTU08327.1 hypothetical protein CcrC2_gp099 [Caulobacter phage C2]UTU08847.1 hypothetical protein CcrJ4_gp096 [Caulobacter phage J4]UTU09401.1 hypothetical protein CcrBL47_gp115 [Caulobacter phage BL47]UTU09961.1 hypothetical protein CcrRB23_gp099 [Caulobacter phage RB23]WGN96986.1 hypothetical protein [Bertelyvirus sp.]
MPRVQLDDYDDEEDDLSYGGAVRPLKPKFSKIKDGSKRRNYEKYVKREFEIKNIAPICIECGSLAKLTSGAIAFPRRPEFHREQAYLCDCGARVRCHPGTTIAQGFPAKHRVSEARWSAHNAFDALWRDGPFTRFLNARSRAYAWLAEELEMDIEDCHFGMFDLNTCRRATTLCETLARTGTVSWPIGAAPATSTTSSSAWRP